jgi:hypothetical protein
MSTTQITGMYRIYLVVLSLNSEIIRPNLNTETS